MSVYEVQTVIDKQPTFTKPIEFILAHVKAEILNCKHGGAFKFKALSAAEYWSDQQRKFWKGILLPALSKDTGDSIAWWEAELKTKVMPDDFKPIFVDIDGETFATIPSITTLSKKKMNQMVEGSVAYCRDECGLQWVTLPDSSLRT